MGTIAIHMLLAVGRLFNLNSRPPFFYREDAAIPACAEHMWAGRIAPLRPRRTASHICCIRGNPAPLTCGERVSTRGKHLPERTFQDHAESAGRIPPWRCSEKLSTCGSLTPQSSDGPVWASCRTCAIRPGSVASNYTHDGPALGTAYWWSVATATAQHSDLPLMRAVGNAPPQVCCRRPFFCLLC